MFEPDFVTFDAGGVALNVAVAGDPSAPLVICLHGFPEYWAAWRDVMADLARDHFVVAPDQRGFNLSAKPAGIAAYRAKHMVADLAALADRFSPARPFALAGHDWGASIAYAYAFAHPDRLSHLIIANGVHPWCFQNAIFHDPAQREASQYINVLRAPGSDERMAEDGFRRTSRMIEGFSRTGWMTPDIRAGYLAAWAMPGAMGAMLNWYRASPIVVPLPGETPGEALVMTLPVEALAVSMPHLVVWGSSDEALLPSCLDGLDRFAPDLTIEKVPGAGHWILHEKPAEVAAAMRTFLSRA
ncbi:MAG: alpha/beta fold hydrolase [Mesorhizobium sp.]|nr:alpha/beta fold hydrolase [Mesorhizobium sp.]